mgnify:CR=1 FL=1
MKNTNIKFIGWYYTKGFNCIEAIFLCDEDTMFKYPYTYYTHIGQHTNGVSPDQHIDMKKVSLKEAKDFDPNTVEDVLRIYKDVKLNWSE